MSVIAKKAAPAAIAVLRQATALAPKRKRASDGLLPSAAHIKASPNSDHNTGFAVDLTHDPKNGIDCHDIMDRLKEDNRVKYLIFDGYIWAKDRADEGDRKYTGINKHEKHLHISIKETKGLDTSPWFPWLGKPKTVNKIVSKVKPLRKKGK